MSNNFKKICMNNKQKNQNWKQQSDELLLNYKKIYKQLVKLERRNLIFYCSLLHKPSQHKPISNSREW